MCKVGLWDFLKFSMCKDTVKYLKKQNDSLKQQLDLLKEEMKNIEVKIDGNSAHGEEHAGHVRQAGVTPDPETRKSLESLSQEYDEEKRFSSVIKQQIPRLETHLTELAIEVDKLSNAIDEALHYSP